MKKLDKSNIKAITPDKIDDFTKVYEVFIEAPYYEAWTKKMIQEEYESLSKNGHIYGYYLNNECIGLVTFRPMRLNDNHPVHYEHSEKVAYLADLAVLKNHRRKGVGTALMQYALDIMKEEGFEIVYMKTLEIGKSMSYNIAVKSGFKLLEGVKSIDKMERVIKERNEEDIKIYLEKQL